MKSELISKLIARAGKFSGRGVNHEGQAFEGELALTPLLKGKGIHLSFKATGDDCRIFHEETTTIAPNHMGEIGLYNLNTNMPGLTHHRLIEESAEKAIFAFGNRADSQSFREEISLELHLDGSISYKYAWGLPGGEFADRSGALMAQVEEKC